MENLNFDRPLGLGMNSLVEGRGDHLGSISPIGHFGDLSDEISSIQQIKIIADYFRVSYPYLCRPTDVKPKLREVRHESSLCRQDMDGLLPVAFKKNTLRSYESVITHFCRDHGNVELEELTVDLVQSFLESITNGRKPQTRKIRFAHITSFFNFVHNNPRTAKRCETSDEWIENLYG
jgi:hypothetical protein